MAKDQIRVVVIDLVVHVIDLEALEEFLLERQKHRALTLLEKWPGNWSAEDMVREALIYSNCNPLPEIYGAVLLPETSYSRMRGGEISIKEYIEVPDEVALWSYAFQRYKACNFAEMWEEKKLAEMTLPTAVLEAVILSNENPVPMDYGIEIDTFSARMMQSSLAPTRYKDILAMLSMSN